ncbi:hypothetical protein EGH82_15410 [Vibrio ponticus]|uniref:Uncharacterized protein n=2 Tax=Vibrio ponticus TaxID=265668 RepID=A0A3N3DX40_9VIBR|nr:hypothetical protein EGH82_15410 [Vibrio ponticus]
MPPSRGLKAKPPSKKADYLLWYVPLKAASVCLSFQQAVQLLFAAPKSNQKGALIYHALTSRF